jgi:hypothetical protein
MGDSNYSAKRGPWTRTLRITDADGRGFPRSSSRDADRRGFPHSSSGRGLRGPRGSSACSQGLRDADHHGSHTRKSGRGITDCQVMSCPSHPSRSAFQSYLASHVNPRRSIQGEPPIPSRSHQFACIRSIRVPSIFLIRVNPRSVALIPIRANPRFRRLSPIRVNPRRSASRLSS